MSRADRLRTLHKLQMATGHLVRLKAEYPSSQEALMVVLQFYADTAYRSFMSATDPRDIELKAHKYQAVHKVLDLLSDVITYPEKMHEAFKKQLSTIESEKDFEKGLE